MNTALLLIAFVGQIAQPVTTKAATAPPVVITAPAPKPITAPAPVVAPVVTPTPVAATSPAISGPATIQEHTGATFTVPGFDAVAWTVIPSIWTDLPTTSSVSSKVSVTGAPGSYTILAAIVVGGQPMQLMTILTVQAAPASTPVTAAPQTPTTNTGGLWAYAVFDQSKLTSLPAKQLAIYTGQTLLKETLEASGVHFSVISAKDHPGLVGATSPSLAVMNGPGSFALSPTALPASAADVIAMIQTLLPKAAK